MVEQRELLQQAAQHVELRIGERFRVGHAAASAASQERSASRW